MLYSAQISRWDRDTVCVFVYGGWDGEWKREMLMYLWCSEVCYGVQRHVKAREGDSDDGKLFVEQ